MLFYTLKNPDDPGDWSETIMCQKLGESVTAPLTGASGIVMSSNGVVTQGWACDKTDCPSYGKWYCPFSW
jgi:hypothetical protein